MPFDLDKEKIRCLMVLDDGIAGKLSCKAGPAYWRAFILENRETHQVYVQFRFKYQNGEKSWFQTRLKKQTSPEAATEELRCGLEDVMKTGLGAFGADAEAAENAIQCYYPPDDGGDPAKTIILLEQQDLVEVTIEKTLPKKTDA